MHSSCGDRFSTDELCTPPEVCANAEESKEQHLLKHAAFDHNENIVQRTLKRDRPLIVAIILLVILMRIPYLKFSLYPFMIFSTWVHEFCGHGMAAICLGGGITKIYIYKDGSGLAYSWTDGQNWKRGMVASAGYVVTTLLGAFFLLFRRTRRGPTAGLLVIGCTMLLSCALYVRNAFGVVSTLLIGISLLLAGWQMPERIILYLYCFLAATCSFNALDSINDLMDMQPGEAYVNGQQSSTDAHTVADLWGLTYQIWALIWLIFGFVMSAIGLLLPFNGVTYLMNQNQQRKQQKQAELAFTGGGGGTATTTMTPFSSQVPYAVAPSAPAQLY